MRLLRAIGFYILTGIACNLIIPSPIQNPLDTTQNFRRFLIYPNCKKQSCIVQFPGLMVILPPSRRNAAGEDLSPANQTGNN
ncbi:hypothetical protein [Methanobrevibacter sp. UBA212]|uniref:hypothetical protein n=1 Tax=Methanobrevibacter sp. UBA212 TaxID=1915476 RepID=UPI0025F53809|nr:hypothetical protein [Methanobrevibacter sp. UBA212]